MSFFSTLNDILRLFLKTALPLYLFFWVLLHLAIGTFWSLFASFIYPDELGSPEFGILFAGLNAIAAYVIVRILLQQTSGYAQPIKNYLGNFYFYII